MTSRERQWLIELVWGRARYLHATGRDWRESEAIRWASKMIRTGKQSPGITPDMLSEDDRRHLAKLVEYARRETRGYTFGPGDGEEFRWAKRMLNQQPAEASDG